MTAADLAKENEELRRENRILEELILQVEERLDYWRTRYLAAVKQETRVPRPAQSGSPVSINLLL